MDGEDQPEIATVTAKGQITIPSSLRERYEIGEGDRLLAVPTEHGIVLKKIELPSVEEFRERVEKREVDMDMDEVNELVHEGR
jgi:antitoxin PrlF